MIPLNDFDNYPFHMFAKDLDGRYVYCNNPDSMNRPSCVGLSDRECPWGFMAEEYERTDRIALETGYIECIQPLMVGEKIVNTLVRKLAWHTQDGKLKGVIGFTQPLNAVAALDTPANQSLKLPLSRQQAKQLFDGITAREAEILYYLVRGQSSAQIATELDLSDRTVTSYIGNLKHRWGVKTKGQLISVAIEGGFNFFIPESLQEKLQQQYFAGATLEQ